MHFIACRCHQAKSAAIQWPHELTTLVIQCIIVVSISLIKMMYLSAALVAQD